MFYVVDASVYVFRAWFSIPDDMVDGEGNPVNALYGYTRFLGDFLEHSKPGIAAVAFDTSLTTCFRNDIYPDYKANREPAPPELKLQFEWCREVTRALGMKDYAEVRYEADDIIGTLVMRMRDQGMKSTILSRDKDLLQLLDAGDVLWDFAGGKRTHYKDVPDSFGVKAEQMVDYLALAGDSVDNVPGVRGVGPKTASALLQHFDSLDRIYDRLEEVAGVPVRGAAKLGARLEAHHEDALLSRELCRIACDIPMESGRQYLTRSAPDLDALNDLYDRADFGQALRRQAQRIADQF
ncbi:MAG: 5'-3' exonuclease H3TH domain-containing protein [Gammaproteobacteria bacterium]|jgi:5'-3' exonuclease|nr:5'-3' exonuclease H3TH domain-containing protein [Gammaproteobacteria bacterium]MDP6617547.1 5'-3' exonuclease H3TH domain-containing protein [Gammaproteobacteria bacterium]MDP6694424.1 5'-3' exonuclease H3TH domain-containing protein [Gammaproteobacteria bacterium]MDP7041119.1 5'-3' exonuclease H3TH domain-containing protein [Gammaproteobacteria bacterium]